MFNSIESPPVDVSVTSTVDIAYILRQYADRIALVVAIVSIAAIAIIH